MELLREYIKEIINEISLYHGTINDHENSIKNYGLIPSVGQFVQDSYGEVIDAYDSHGEEFEELVFAADKNGLERAVIAMRNAIGNKLGKYLSSVNEEDILKHGMIVKFEDAYGWEHRAEEDENYYGEHPPHVEPGDHYSRHNMRPDKIFIGNSLLRLLRRHKLLPLDRVFPENTKSEKQKLIHLAIKAHPNVSKEQILQKINSLEPKEYLKYIRAYQNNENS